MNGTDGDRRIARTLAWILAVSFPLATLIIVLLFANISAPEPVFREGDNVLADNLVIGFTSDQERWPQELAANLIFVVGFAAVAGLGAFLPTQIGGADGARRFTGTAFVVAASLGIVGMLLYIGVKEVAANPMYCECGSRDAQLISRVSVLDAASNAQNWLTDTFAVLLGLGLVAASFGTAMSSGWRTYSRWVGVAALVIVLTGRLLPVIEGVINNPETDLRPVGELLLVLLAGILVPIWAFWTARALSDHEALEPST